MLTSRFAELSTISTWALLVEYWLADSIHS